MQCIKYYLLSIQYVNYMYSTNMITENLVLQDLILVLTAIKHESNQILVTRPYGSKTVLYSYFSLFSTRD